MSAAVFVLSINFCIALIFAAAFGLVAAYARSAVGARWLALGYGIGMLNPALELLLPMQGDPRAIQIAIPLSLLLAVGLGVIGLARHYRLSPPWWALGAITVATLALNIAIIDMARTATLRNLLYQLPFFAVHLLAVITMLRFPRRQLLDDALVALFAVTALQFLCKPLLAAAMGTGTTAQTYIGSTYAAVSQSLGGVLLIAIGLMVLLIILRDAMAEMTARSETDKLSGLLNRRGFEDRADALLATAQRSGKRGAMLVADIDHFKSINDGYGHEAGDRVIAAFARLLADTTDAGAVVGRLGGEEFAVFIADADLATTRLRAEAIRFDFATLSIAELDAGRRVTASLGLAALRPGDTLSDLLRRADAALYEAKKSGRDRVCVAPELVFDL